MAVNCLAAIPFEIKTAVDLHSWISFYSKISSVTKFQSRKYIYFCFGTNRLHPFSRRNSILSLRNASVHFISEERQGTQRNSVAILSLNFLYAPTSSASSSFPHFKQFDIILRQLPLLCISCSREAQCFRGE